MSIGLSEKAKLSTTLEALLHRHSRGSSASSVHSLSTAYWPAAYPERAPPPLESGRVRFMSPTIGARTRLGPESCSRGSDGVIDQRVAVHDRIPHR